MYNGQGDVIAIYRSADGVLMGTYEYDLWGKPVKTTSASADTNKITAKNPIRYRGYYYDVEAGLYYLNARYYDPSIRRFINADSLAFLGGGDTVSCNLYAYCNNNPVNAEDPTGNNPLLLFAGIALCVLVCAGCTSKPQSDIGAAQPYVYVSGNNDPITTVYDDMQLSEIAAFKGSMNELNNKYPIECLKQYGDDYQAIYLGNRKIAKLIFDNSGNRVMGRVYNMHLPQSDFDVLSKGQSLEEVMELDPDGSYLFLHTGVNEPRISCHYTIDGYLITIEYDDSNSIISINKWLI